MIIELINGIILKIYIFVLLTLPKKTKWTREAEVHLLSAGVHADVQTNLIGEQFGILIDGSSVSQ